MKKILTFSIISLIFVLNFSVFAADQFITLKSKNSVSSVIDKLEQIVSKKGLTVFSRVKHSQSAKNIKIDIDESELLIFGNPAIGSKIMQCNPEIGIELPLKALAYKNEKGEVFIKYTNLSYIQSRYKLGSCAKKAIEKASFALSKITQMAIK